jgi:hypothetical protein
VVVVELKFSARTTGGLGQTTETIEQTITAEGHTMDQAVNKAVHKLSDYLSRRES